MQAAAETSTRTVAVGSLTRGLHSGVADNEMPLGYSPSLRNWVPAKDGMTRRSALSAVEVPITGSANTMHYVDRILGAWRCFDTVGADNVTFVSEGSIYVITETQSTPFQQYLPFPTTPSGTSADVWDAAQGVDGVLSGNYLLLTNGVDPPYQITFRQEGGLGWGVATESSLFSAAKSVTVSDARVVWFNTTSASSVFPTRVVWSPRGRLVSDYDLLDGAGAADLVEMRGVGIKVIAVPEGVLLFSTEEVWKGRLRRDAYVYDFYPIARQVGTDAPRTVVETPTGVMFLGTDRELYVVAGDSVIPLGPAAAGEESRVRRYLRPNFSSPHRAWAVYNEPEHRYELYYCSFDEDDPSRAIYYSLDHNSFWPQLFLADSPSAGVLLHDQDGPEQLHVWPSSLTGARHAVFDSSKTQDVSSGFSATWVSPALSGAGFQNERLTDLWIDREGSTRSFRVGVSSTYGAGYSSTAESVHTVGWFTARAHLAVNGVASSGAAQFRIALDSAYSPQIQGFGARVVSLGNL